jgi:hypothetical protein
VVLSKLAYLTLCRSIQLLVLLARGEAARIWRSWCSVTSSRCCAAKSRVPASSPPTAFYLRPSAGRCPEPAGRASS